MTSSAASETDRARKRVPGDAAPDAPHHLQPAAAGQVHVEQHHLRVAARRRRPRPRRRRPPRRAPRPGPGAAASSARTPVRNIAWSSTTTTRAPVPVAAVIRVLLAGRRSRSGRSRTSVPSPGAVRIVGGAAVPLASGPRCCGGRRAGPRARRPASKPRPRSRTKTSTAARADLGVDVDPGGAGVLGGVDHRLARGQDQRAQRSATGASPTATTSTGDAVVVLDLGGRRAQRARPPRRPSAGSAPYSQERRSRSWARARRATAAGSAACFWIRARVCSTESCRCAATSARSWVRTRSARSSDRSPASRNSQGPTTRARPATPSTAGAAPRVGTRADRAAGLARRRDQRRDQQRDPGAEPGVAADAAGADDGPQQVDPARCCRASAPAGPRRPAATGPPARPAPSSSGQNSTDPPTTACGPAPRRRVPRRRARPAGRRPAAVDAAAGPLALPGRGLQARAGLLEAVVGGQHQPQAGVQRDPEPPRVA